eukprot:8556186-Alexandrium_andersonii.AAC.1
MSASLVGSEMCIRDSRCTPARAPHLDRDRARLKGQRLRVSSRLRLFSACLLYTSDAADDM